MKKAFACFAMILAVFVGTACMLGTPHIAVILLALNAGADGGVAALLGLIAFFFCAAFASSPELMLSFMGNPVVCALLA